MANKFTQQMKVSKVPATKTSVDIQPTQPAVATVEPEEIDPLAQYSEADLKDVVTLSVKLPAVVRQAIRTQCAQENIKLATEVKKWLVERFDLPEGFTAETILSDGRTK